MRPRPPLPLRYRRCPPPHGPNPRASASGPSRGSPRLRRLLLSTRPSVLLPARYWSFTLLTRDQSVTRSLSVAEPQPSTAPETSILRRFQKPTIHASSWSQKELPSHNLITTQKVRNKR